MVDDVRQLRDGEGMADRRQRWHGWIDPALPLRPVTLGAGELVERMSSGGDLRGNGRIRRRGGCCPGRRNRERLRTLAVMTSRVRNEADRDRERDPRTDDGWQNPNLALRPLIFGHALIFYF